MRVILDTHRRRRLLQRTVAVAVLVAAIVLAGSAEGLRWASHRRIADAQQALQRLAVARESALVARRDHMRRQLNRSGFRARAAAIATLTPADRPMLRAFLERGNWKLELETASFESAQRFSAAFGGRPTLQPRNVHRSLGWVGTVAIPGGAWTGSPAPA